MDWINEIFYTRNPVIATSQVPFDIDVPVVDGIPFLTGIGREEVVDQKEEILKNAE